MKRVVAAFRHTVRPAVTLTATSVQCWVALLVLLAALLAASAAEAQLELFVANQEGEGHVGQDSIVVYQVNGVGTQTNLTRLRTLVKPDVGVDLTGLATPAAVGIIQDKLFVANRSGGASKTGSITVYSRTAQGNTPPEATLEGPEFDLPSGLAVTETELFVANQSVVSQSQVDRAPSIAVYQWSRNSQGKVVFNPTTPVRRIKGISTGLDGPGFLALDRAHDELFVSNKYSGAVTVYKRNDVDDQHYRRRLFAVGFTGFTLATGVAVDPARDELFLAYGFAVGSGTISVWTRTASDTPPLPPIRTLTGPATKVDTDAPNGLALDVANNRFFVANRGTDNFRGSITVHALTWDSTVAPFANQPALRQFQVPELFSPVALALFDANSFDFTLTVTPPEVTAGPGSSTSVTVTATVTRGAGSVTFTEPVSDLQAIGASGTFLSQTPPIPPNTNKVCSFTVPGSCSRTLSIRTGSQRGRFPINVEATGAPASCGTEGDPRLPGSCDVVREAPFTLIIPEDLIGTLRLLKTGTGRCTVTSAPAGIACGLDQTDCSASFSAPTVTLTAVPENNQTFVTGWDYTGCTNQPSCQVTLTPNSTTTVRLSCDVRVFPLTVQITGSGQGSVTSTPAGIVCPTDCQENYIADTRVTLTATPVPDSSFASWSPNCVPVTNVPNQCTVTMSEARTVVATLIGPRVTVVKVGRGTVTSAPQGIFCDPTCGPVTFNSGTEIVLTAVPELPGWRFGGWSGCTSTNNDKCTVRPTAPQTTVTATFVAIGQLTVTNLPLGGQGTVTSDKAGNDGQPISCPPACVKTFDVGTTVTLTSATNAIQVGWRTDCAGFASRGQPPTQCAVQVAASGTNIDVWFVGTLPQAFVARLYFNVLPGIRPTPQGANDLLQNINDLVKSVQVAPLLSVRALIDAFFDGPNRPRRPAVSSADYVRIVVRALLWREPNPVELDAGRRFLDQSTSSGENEQLAAERQLRGYVIDGPLRDEFEALIGSVFGTPTL